MRQVIKKQYIKVVNVEDIDDSKIYAYKDATHRVFKLHQVGIGDREGWAFIACDDSLSVAQWINHTTSQKAVSFALDMLEKVYEFDTQDGFLRWALNKGNF